MKENDLIAMSQPRHQNAVILNTSVREPCAGRSTLGGGRPPVRARENRSDSFFALIVILAVAALPSFAFASERSAARHLRQGIRHYRRGQFQAAAKAFAEADIALPEDPRIAFDQACAAAAQHDAEQAVELFQRAALARDAALAANAHYNLGCIAAVKAKSVFGAHPEQAPPNARQEGLTLLAQAVAHYRDCLRVDANHRGARHNLEVVRLWIKHMQDLWAQRDRQKRREEMDLLRFLEMIQAEQGRLRQAARALEKQDDSPRRRQAISETESAQRQLAEEMDPLKKKIGAALEPPPPPGSGKPPQQTAPVPNARKALDLLNNLADEAHQKMLHAADELAGRSVRAAVQAQTDALDALNDIYMAVAPFSHLLAKATAAQQDLVEQSNRIVARRGPTNRLAPAQPPEGTSTSNKPPAADHQELSRKQTLVSRWSEILPPKAKQQLEQLQAAPSGPPAGAGKTKANPKPVEQARQGLKQSLEKAIRLGPKIHQLAAEAAEQLEGADVEAALPKQQQALKLLKEIAQTLPKQPHSPKQKGQQEQPQQKPQQGDPKNRSQEEQPPKQHPRDLARQQVEAVLRKVRERERKHREMQRQLRQYLRGSAQVDKDW